MVRRCPRVSKAYSPKKKLTKAAKETMTITIGGNVFIDLIMVTLADYAGSQEN